jgi:hypothetical protein
MRHIYNASSPGSSTPIYDALYAEYSRLFRTLPGDRSGEEGLRFEGFGTVRGTGTGHWGNGGNWCREPVGWRREVTGRRHAAQLPAALPPAPRDGHAYGL